LGYVYVDSGAVYRGVTWAALRRGVETQDEAAVARMLESLRFDVIVEGNAVRVRYDGADPGQEIRGPDVTANVSFIAAMPAVRARVTQCLRDMARFGSLVMEGRDIGSVVFPESPYKFYLDASPGERARRRHLETAGQGGESAVRAESERLKRRDAIDSRRQAAPLRVAPGAVIVDSTAMNIDQVVAFILGAF
jgi:cytidylate kinase